MSCGKAGNALARHDDRDKFAGPAVHCCERRVAAFDEALQVAKAGRLSRLAYRPQRCANEPLPGQSLKGAAEQRDEIDLTLAVLGAADFAIGGGVSPIGNLRHLRIQRLDHRSVEIFRQSVELDGVSDGLKTPASGRVRAINGTRRRKSSICGLRSFGP